MTRKYCKASYLLKELRQFSDREKKREKKAPELSDDDIVYLWDDFTVVRRPIISGDGVLFDAVSTEWQEFCKTTLHFEEISPL